MAITIIAKDGRSFHLESELTVGRDASCTIAIPHDASASRQHARFFWLHGLPTIEDLGSRNGTFLNGARITQARSISSGDEVRIGNELFRVEATLDNVSSPAPSTGAKEISRGERGKNKRRGEQSGAEGSLYGTTGVQEWNPLGGCSLPNVNLAGCLKYLWIILLLIIVAVVIGLIIMGIGTILTSANGVVSQGASGTGAGSQSAGRESPPPAQSPPPQSPKDNQQKPTNAPSVEGIHIKEVRIDFHPRGGDSLKAIVLVHWVNLTKEPVRKLTGTVTIFDDKEKLLVEIPRELIYGGSPVNPGEEHLDSVESEGIVIRQKLTSPPSTAKVTVERVE